MSTHPVPLYRQTSDFSCGAASLVMALAGLRGRPATRSEEWELWRVATMIGIPGIDQWGLALAARGHGVPATVVSTSDVTFPHRRGAPRWFSAQQVEITMFAQGENRERARRAGVAHAAREPSMEDVTAALGRGEVPVLLVDLHTLSRGQDMAPHWVVAVEAAGGKVTLHDPAADGPGTRRIPLAEAWECMDVSTYEAARTLVLLGP